MYNLVFEGFNLKIGCLNVRGLNDRLKRKRLYKHIRANKWDIFLAQETFITSENLLIWEKEWGGKLFTSIGSNNSKGTSIFLSKHFDYVVNSEKIDPNGRYNMINVMLTTHMGSSVEITIANVYAPNKDDPTFFQKFFSDLEDFSSEHIIVGGDWNLVLDIDRDSKNRRMNNCNARDIVVNYKDKLHLCDIWRAKNPEASRYTHYVKKTRCAARLDMLLVSDNLTQFSDKVDIEGSVFSDHSQMTCMIAHEQNCRGKGTWKLNVTLLEDAEYTRELKTKIDKWWKTTTHLTIHERWEWVKNKIREYSIAFGVKLSQRKQTKREKLNLVLKDLENERDTQFVQAIDRDTIDNVKNKIIQIEEDMARGCIFRSKAQWLREGEKNTRYFYSLEKRNYNRKTMSKIFIPGQEIECCERQKILNEQKRFYEELYTRDKGVSFKVTNNTGIVVSEAQLRYLNTDITLSECYTSLKEMKNGKTPGSDGLPAEFYKHFWETLAPILQDLYIECMDKKKLNKTARHGLISLIPKGDKDTRYLKNWRPLTLLNLDYKIIAKVLATRLKTVLPSIIGNQQTGFMEGRQISENIRKTIDVISYVNSVKGKKCLIMTIDMEKCFDRIEYCAIQGSLEYFGITGRYADWISMFFNDFYVNTQNAGFLSPTFYKTRSINQGCNISPYLYLLCGEILAHKLKYNEQIKGVDIGDVTMLLSQFADDTTLFLEYDEISLQQLVHTLSYIEAHTGLKVSYDKTVLYRVGSIQYSSAKLYTSKPFQWSDGDINVLGITIRNHAKQTSDSHNVTIDKMCKIMNSWYARTLTLIGKCMVINTLMSSLFVYRLSVLPDMTAVQLSKIDKIMREYLWRGKKSKIPLRVLQNCKDSGGLKLCNFSAKQNALKLVWIKRLTQNESLQYAYMWLLPILREDQWKCNINARDVRMLLSYDNFWVNVLISWTSIQFRKEHHGLEILDEFLWYNSHIRIGGQPIMWSKAYQNGLYHVRDLLDENFEFLTFQEISEHFGPCMTWLEFEQLKAALPPRWRTLLKTQLPDETLERPHIEKLMTLKKPVAYFYEYIVRLDEFEVLFPYLVRFQQYVVSISMREYCNLFKNVYKITNVVKLRNFQYRLLLFKIFSNRHLYHWKIRVTDCCDYCNESQTREHMLWDCSVAKHLWTKLEKWLNIEIHHTTPYLLDKKNGLHNFFILVTNQFIFRCKCQGVIPKWPALEREFQELEKLELWNARQNSRIKQHVKKWGQYRPSLYITFAEEIIAE